MKQMRYERVLYYLYLVILLLLLVFSMVTVSVFADTAPWNPSEELCDNNGKTVPEILEAAHLDEITAGYLLSVFPELSDSGLTNLRVERSSPIVCFVVPEDFAEFMEERLSDNGFCRELLGQELEILVPLVGESDTGGVIFGTVCVYDGGGGMYSKTFEIFDRSESGKNVSVFDAFGQVDAVCSAMDAGACLEKICVRLSSTPVWNGRARLLLVQTEKGNFVYDFDHTGNGQKENKANFCSVGVYASERRAYEARIRKESSGCDGFQFFMNGGPFAVLMGILVYVMLPLLVFSIIFAVVVTVIRKKRKKAVPKGRDIEN